MFGQLGSGGFYNLASAQSYRDYMDISGAKKTAQMQSILNGGAQGRSPNAAQQAFQSMTAPTAASQANAQVGPEAFRSAIMGSLTGNQSAALRNYYTPQMWNGFTGTDEFANGGTGGGGGIGGGGNLSGSTMNYDTLGKERLAAQNALDLSLLNQTGRQTSLSQLLPILGTAFNAAGSVGGNLTGTQPTINAGPIYTPQQTQQQVNQAVGGNDSRFAGLMRSLQSRFGASGFSPNSAAFQALAAQLGVQNTAANADVRTSLPFDVASGNATQLLNSQVARENQFANRQQEQLGSQRNAIAMLSSILGIL
ncbi:MAG: hypothetical protein C0483_18740 [Pirellula sp.]|nr:hypothetical protein [Pirellula sp.]